MPQSSAHRVIIAGGSGFLGATLARRLTDSGHDVVALARSGDQADQAWTVVRWDGRTIGEWADVIDGADVIVNLAGRSVDCMKTPDHCDEILRSRIESTRVLGEACHRSSSPPRVWVQMSTAHIYGDPPSAVCDEDSSLGYGLAPDVGRAWESEFHNVCPVDTRGVVLRTGFVLGASGGAFVTLSRLVRQRLGGTVGHGAQGMSWIHIEDFNRIVDRAISERFMSGVYIVSAPHPVSNREFMKELRNALGVRIGLPAPSWMVRFGARFVLHTDPELALYGRYCVPKRLLDDGYEFAFPTLAPALTDLVRPLAASR